MNTSPVAANAETSRTTRTKRQNLPITKKRRMVEEALTSGKSVKEVAQAHGLRANLLFKWRRMYQDGRLGPVKTESALLPVRVVDSSPATSTTSTPSVQSGAIQIEFARARIRIENGADPALVRAALECLGR